MLAGGAACSGGSEEAGAPVPDCTHAVRATRIPPDIEALALERWGTITKSEARAGFLGAVAVSEQQVVEIYPDMVRRLGASYTFLGGDNEGFEAELSFADSEDRVVSFTLTEVACDKVLIRALFEKRAA
ncbi:MAG: hypothetical protein H0U53_02635 [Actinobacteria bacterium]|nr:hypothetical protein [Actinomycetota bacterium]